MLARTLIRCLPEGTNMMKQATWFAMMMAALAMVGCAGSGTGTGTSGALTIDESTGEASGSFIDESEADLGRVDFTSRFVDTNVLEIVLELHGLTISSLVDFDSGVIEYDGFATENGEDTQILDEDRALLAAFARALDTLGDVSEPLSRVRGFANTWSEFSTTLDPQGIALSDEDRGYSSMCSRVNTYQRATHDCWSGAGDCSNWWGCSRGDDNATTDYGYVSMHASGSCNDGTYFWNGNYWQCFEPDHSGSIEYAYGNCLGRCGGSCGSSTQFTWDCFDHDQCVRTGHDVASAWCDDEFVTTVDDWSFAPNC
ncbi:MAG: hypothetical protein M3Y87_23875 [Myxococcota bacterium]|nr:hypothetical protein [Myxococcota bacterium]